MRNHGSKSVPYRAVNLPKKHKIPIQLEPYREKLKLAPMQPISGVYFLLWKGDVVYVGQSTNIMTRTTQHRNRYNWKYDSVLYIETLINSLTITEDMWIHYLQPIYNIKGKDKR